MDILNFRDIVVSDRSSQRYLASVCRVIGGNACPRCGSDEIYKIESGKRKRCSGCGYRFTLYSGRWLNEAHISPRSWLWIIKLFEMELTAKKISEETEICYPTTLKAVTSIRRSIAATTTHGMAVLRDPDGSSRIPIFYSKEHEDSEILAVLPADRIKILARLEHGHLICTDRDIRHDSLLCEGIWHGHADPGSGRPRLRIYLAHPFRTRRFILERLNRHHGIKDALLPLHVLEAEFRFKNNGTQLFEMLVESVCRFIPPGLPGQHGNEAVYLSANQSSGVMQSF